MVSQNLGDKILRRRRELGLSQQQLAGTEMSRSFLSLVERNKCRPSHDLLQVIALRLQKPAEYFTTDGAWELQAETALYLVKTAEGALAKKDWDAASQHSQLALRHCAVLHEPDLEARAFLVLATCRREQGDLDGAMEALETRLDCCSRTGNKSDICTTYLELGRCAFQLEDFAAAERYYRRAMNMSEGLKSLSHQYVSAAVSLATTVTRLGQYEKAVETYKIALPEVDPKQDGWRWAMTMMGMGWAERCMGRLQEALLHSRQSHAMLVKLDHPDRLLVEHNLAILEMDMGNLREALAKLEQCKASYRNGGNIGQEASVGEDITRCHLRLEQFQQARKEADQALRLLDLADNNWIRGRLYLLKAEIAMRFGQETEAHSFLDIGTAIFRRVRAVAELQRAEELGRMLTAPVNVTPSQGSL